MTKLENIVPTGSRANTAKISAQLDRIDAALERGLTRQEIFEALKEELALTCGFDGFCYALKTARAKAKKT
ncbi:hypothetical protein [Burkholderia gladioli]|uniref:hypothetical protein n=1 Tax=Burkholderia gladioli TaxID=28095 RepID=UPI00285FA689|nr:hypothetical protein [Burkholderia gladioli]MDR8091071.1 hypothetical protein [Burkholderia gladioli]